MLGFRKGGAGSKVSPGRIAAGVRDLDAAGGYVPGADRKAGLTTGLPPRKARSGPRAADPVLATRPAGDVGMGDVISALRRRTGTIVLVTLLALFGALAFVNVVSPRYTAEARLLLENRDSYYSRPEKDGRSSTEAIDPEAVQSQVQVIASRDLARAVIRKLELGSLPEFDPVLRGIPSYMRLLILIGIVRDPTLSSPEERVLESYFNKVSISAVGKSRVIGIEVTTLKPEIAAKIANTIAREYLDLQTEAKKQTTQIASAWLNQTIEPLRQRVIEADAKVEAYRAKNDLYIGPSNTSFSNQQLSELNTQLSSARANLADQQGRAQLIREALHGGRIFEISDVLKDDLVRRLSENRSNLRALYASESKIYLPLHPRLKELQAQIGDLETQIRAAAERTARALENDAKASKARVAALSVEIEAQKKVTATSNGEDVTLKALEREAKALRDQLETYQAKAIDANARDHETGSPADARIVSIALAPSVPSFPKSAPIVILATLSGLILSSFLVIAGQLLRTQATLAALPPVRTEPPMSEVPKIVPASEPHPGPAPSSEEGIAGAAVRSDRMPAPDESISTETSPLIAKDSRAVVPEHIGQGLDPQARLVLEPASLYARAIEALTERCRKTRREAEVAGRTGAWRVLVTSVASGQGATSVAISLGRRLSEEARTILVELNEANPEIDLLIGEGEATGLSDLLYGLATFGDAIHRDHGSKLHLMPLGLCDGAIAGAEVLPRIIEALCQSYDFLLIDGGVAEHLSDDMLARLDIAVLVATGDREAADTQAAYHRLNEAGVGSVSVMFNEPETPFRAGVSVANDQSALEDGSSLAAS